MTRNPNANSWVVDIEIRSVASMTPARNREVAEVARVVVIFVLFIVVLSVISIAQLDL